MIIDIQDWKFFRAAALGFFAFKNYFNSGRETEFVPKVNGDS